MFFHIEKQLLCSQRLSHLTESTYKNGPSDYIRIQPFSNHFTHQRHSLINLLNTTPPMNQQIIRHNTRQTPLTLANHQSKHPHRLLHPIPQTMPSNQRVICNNIWLHTSPNHKTYHILCP
ncbi:hypothetical protein V8G54_011152 [Vigna mungo]|uniref:Uncharacterized protein n=1 Tax=Vigna mungo TaxID=3915 RepID=A0AAQ3NP48_VIGMU